ncbi:MAG: hypothetical protein ACYCQL_02170, partial [Acidithiobacillus sp.]
AILEALILLTPQLLGGSLRFRIQIRLQYKTRLIPCGVRTFLGGFERHVNGAATGQLHRMCTTFGIPHQWVAEIFEGSIRYNQKTDVLHGVISFEK